MLQNLLYGLSAVFALVPASVAAFSHARAGAGRSPGAVFWILLTVAVAGPFFRAMALLGGTWHTGLATTLWVSIAACMVLFAGISATTRSGWRLTPLLLPYLALLGVLALLAGPAGEGVLRGGAPGIWIDLHIAVSVITYGLVTLGAVAALAAFLQERALKAKRPTMLTRTLPPLADSEVLQVRLLTASAVVLGLGLVTGSSVQHFETGSFLVADHKTLFSVASFVVICGLVTAHFVSGVRGRRAARIALVAYLLLTLGYLGVKFVTGVLLS